MAMVVSIACEGRAVPVAMIRKAKAFKNAAPRVANLPL